MRIIKSPKELTRLLKRLKSSRKKIGFVPTMGALHEGHLSLVRAAKKQNHIVVVSIFVNPTQFGPHEDFEKYPRDFKKDATMLAKEKINFLFAPSKSAVYPKSFHGYLKAGELADMMCGIQRPGHFDGVATVVKRLFDIVLPDHAYFGQKDYQQALIIQSMVKRFHLPIKVHIKPIIREVDGIAMSSRNVYLTPEQRVRARAISASLKFAKILIHTGIQDARILENKIRHLLNAYMDKIDYVKIVDSKTLKEVKYLKGRILIAVAAFVGKTRLIDNLLIKL